MSSSAWESINGSDALATDPALAAEVLGHGRCDTLLSPSFLAGSPISGKATRKGLRKVFRDNTPCEI